jgi:acyl-CoA oxidase
MENPSSTNTVNRRLNVVLSHLNASQDPIQPGSNNKSQVTDITLNLTSAAGASDTKDELNQRYFPRTQNHTPTFNVSKMGDILRGDTTREEKVSYYKIMDRPELRRRLYNVPKEKARRIVENQARIVLEMREFKISDMKVNPIKLLNKVDTVNMVDPSVGIKIGVQMVLFGGSIFNLGTKYHHDKYLEDVSTLKLPGCFAMTELEHGSNVRRLETTATYEPSSEEFVINTPHDGAIKWWIGNAAMSGKMATVFARLITQGKDYGIHAFLVPIRDENHSPMPGVTIGDCGDKVGLHGVDNGFIKFSNVRIPRVNLLNRFGDVKPDGTYVTEIKSEGRRFAAVLGELITGRMTLCMGSLNIRKIGVTIAVRYASQRRQFGPPSSNMEIPILDYRSHQIRLMPILASCYALEFSKREAVKKFARIHSANVSDEELTEVHALTAGMKAISTWDTQKYLQIMRECCGGHGYAAYNRFGQMRNDHDIYQTFEGDNTVLIQQLAGFLLKRFSKQFKGQLLTDGIKYIRRQMGVLVRDRNPVITRLASKKHLRNPDFQLQAFEYRTAKLLQSIASEIQSNKKRLGVFQAWNECLPNMIKLGRAYIEQFTLEQFVKVVDQQQDDPEIRNVLKLACDLYALNIMKNNIGDFLDVIKRNKAKAINTLVEQLCEQMREHAVSMVDAFELPDFVIDAPIGLSNGNYIDNILDYAIKLNPTNRNFPLDEFMRKRMRESSDEDIDLSHEVLEVDL